MCKYEGYKIYILRVLLMVKKLVWNFLKEYYKMITIMIM